MNCVHLLEVVKDRLTLRGRLNNLSALTLTVAIFAFAVVLFSLSYVSAVIAVELCAFAVVLSFFLLLSFVFCLSLPA